MKEQPTKVEDCDYCKILTKIEISTLAILR